MDVIFAFLCDFAEESGGKVHALGVGIDHIRTSSLPATQPPLSVVLAFRFERSDEGVKWLAIRVIDPDGGDVVPPIDGQLTLTDPGDAVGAARVISQLLGVQFLQYGEYAVEVAIGGLPLVSLPLSVGPAT